MALLAKAALLLIVGLVIGPMSQARVLVGSFAEGIAPYVWQENAAIKGIEIDIARAAFKAMGHDIEAKPLPILRMIQNYRDGRIDFVAGVVPEAIPGLYYTEEFLEYADYAITRASKAITLHKLADLLNYRVVGWATAYKDIGLERVALADGLGTPAIGSFTEAPDTSAQIQFFWAGRADVLVIDKYIYLWNVRALAGAGDMAEPLVYHDILTPKIRVRVGFKDRQLRDIFDQGLKKIKANGQYGRIFDNYVK